MTQATGYRQFSRRFHAMGTEVGLWLWNSNEQRAENALAAAERFFARTEARLSRFLPDSELSRLNCAAGQPFAASRVLYDLVAESLAWHSRTGGIFDPTILNALLAYGYDRPFDRILASAPQTLSQGSAAPNAEVTQHEPPHRSDPSAMHAIRLGPQRQITLPAGVGLDLGGIAKGWAIQTAAHRLGMWGPCLVDAGGDIAAVGAPPGEPWVISVAHPMHDEQDIAVLALKNEAVATSSRVYRQWRHDGRQAHHLIDPRRGAPAETNVLSVTVIAPRLPDAEIYAKTALILGEAQGLAYLNNLTGLAALLVCEDGRQCMTASFEERAYVPSNSFTDRFRTAA